MCIVAIAHLASSRYPLIVAANRDEKHDRPSAAADWWNGSGSLLAGRDLAAGGTWLGITGAGRFAAVTNIFETRDAPAERSRGELVTNFLRGSAAPSGYAASVSRDGSLYGAFNLLLRSGTELAFVSNRDGTRSLSAGVHVFSNNAAGQWWSKVDLLAQVIGDTSDRDDLHEHLIEALSGTEARGPLERASESLFVVGEKFGTRCTTVLSIDAAGKARFIEARFVAGGVSAGLAEFDFTVQESRV